MKHIMLALLANLALAPAHAADPFDLEPEPAKTLFWRHDLQLRADTIDGLEGKPVDADFPRIMLRLRTGFDWLPNDLIQFSSVARLNLGSHSNEASRRDLDNEFADDSDIDEFFVRFTPDDAAALTLGQAPLPLILSPALWDSDLRPIGGYLSQDITLGTYSRLRLQLARFNPAHPFFDHPRSAFSRDESRVGATQIAVVIGEGKPYSWHAAASYLEFENIDSQVTEHLARTNRVASNPAPSGFVNEFTIADLQLELRKNRGFPLVLAIDVFRNLEAANDDSGGRISLRLGDALRAGGFEFGVAGQRIQRDAVVAAYNDDDWWFRSWMRGTRAWLGFGATEDFRIQLALFHERRDDWDDYVDRVIVDFRYTF